MKFYKCKLCGKTGNRQDIRKHIRFEHLIKSSKKYNAGEKQQSPITYQMEVFDL